MFEVSFENFRGFKTTGYIPVRPLTLLVGENSAGKTSFLAAVRYLLDLLAGEDAPSFNKDPFHLGTFQHIAHYRGGKAGRASSFILRLRALVSVPRTRLPDTNVDFEVRFNNAESQATINQITISANGESIVASLHPERVSITFYSKGRDRFPLEDNMAVPRVARTDFARYWPF